ncbi:30S ribosomal protein S19 [Candidatus Woesearchaeota archaeon]|nr:30S ribosomal protein S19 [Candidatus Woesearchaeota archaeon]
MAIKTFTFYGKTLEETQKLSLNEFADMLTSRKRRSIKRGLTDVQKKLLKKLKDGKNNVKTHARDMVVLPEMIGKTLRIHNGKEWVLVTLEKEMLGHCLGEFALTRKKVQHSAPGIGATRSSASLSVR